MFAEFRKCFKKSLEIKFLKSSTNSVVLVDKKAPNWALSENSRIDFEKNNSVFTYPRRMYERCHLIQLKKDSDIFSSATAAVNTLNKKKLVTADLIVPKTMNNSKIAQWVNTAILANYEYCFKTNTEQTEENAPNETLGNTLETLYLERDLSNNTEFTYSVASAYSSLYARELANTRGSIATPDFMVQKAQEVYELAPNKVSIEVITGEDLVTKGMNLLYNVGKGASSPPSLVILKYTPVPESAKRIAFVGKGLTFDTGGLNLKPTNSIEDMYLDKSGACAALSAFRWAIETSFPANLICTLALAENAIGSKSYKPLDIITSLKGKTVEIGNTDAEGRLCLADALTYTQLNYKPSTIIDLATLTGAVVVALGEETAGAFGDSKLIGKLSKAGEYYQEHIWHLPINIEHKKSIKGKVADLSNTGKGRYGGASTAAAFLQNFIEKDVEWAHLDIAGPAMAKSQRKQFSAGGTGFGVQLLTRYLIQELSSQKAKVVRKKK